MPKTRKTAPKSRKQSGRDTPTPPAPRGGRIWRKTAGKFSYTLGSKQSRLVIALVVLLLASGFLANRFLFSSRPAFDLPPLPDLSLAEPQVNRKIRNQYAVVKDFPETAEAWGRLAMNLDIHGFRDESVPCYKRAAELDSREFKWPYFCAIALAEIGSQEAGKWFERSQRLRPGYEASYLRYAEIRFTGGDLEKAAEVFQHALEVNPKSSHAFLGLAKIAISRSEFQNSLQYLQNAVSNDPSHGEAHRYLGDVYRRLNEPEKAAQESRLAQQLPTTKPLFDPVYESLMSEGVSVVYYQDRGRTLMERGYYKQAAQEFNVALELRPDALQHNNLGLVLERLGKHDEAIAHFHKAAEMDSMDWNTYQNLGSAYYAIGEDQQALEFLNKSVQINPSSVHVYGILSYVYKRLGRTSEAIAALRKGMKYAPEDFGLAVRLSWLLATSKQAEFRNGEEAVRLTKVACEETNYQFPGIIDVLAAAYAETGEFKKAAETAQQAYQLAAAGQSAAVAEQIRSRLTLYQSNQPYRE